MGRGRGKGKKQSAISIPHDTTVGIEDEKMPLKRRGKTQKPMKDGIEVEDIDKIEDEEDEVGDDSNKPLRTEAAIENSRKRKRAIVDPAMEENAMGNKTASSVLIKNVGYRPNGSRRKNKPRRAAEVGVECD